MGALCCETRTVFINELLPRSRPVRFPFSLTVFLGKAAICLRGFFCRSCTILPSGSSDSSRSMSQGPCSEDFFFIIPRDISSIKMSCLTGTASMPGQVLKSGQTSGAISLSSVQGSSRRNWEITLGTETGIPAETRLLQFSSMTSQYRLL